MPARERQTSVVSTLVEHAVAVLRDAVISGEIPPRSRILIEETAARLGMSAIPVREALRTLASQGLVVPLPRRGYRVADLSAEDVDDTYRLRVILDPMAVRLAVPQLDPEALSDLDSAFDALVKAYRSKDPALTRQCHRAFHWAIYRHCGSQWLLRCLEILWENSERYQQASIPKRGTVEQRAAEHREILHGCHAGDAELAAESMRHHLDKTRDTLRGLLK